MLSFQILLFVWLIVDVALEHMTVMVISVLFRSAFIAEYTENTFLVFSVDYYKYLVHVRLLMIVTPSSWASGLENS